jgi:hypothetical protein
MTRVLMLLATSLLSLACKSHECTDNCKGSARNDDEPKPCEAACEAACACGILPSALGVDSESFMFRCERSEERISKAVTDCLSVPQELQTWCDENDEPGACNGVATCLSRAFADDDIVGRTKLNVFLYKQSDDQETEPNSLPLAGETCVDTTLCSRPDRPCVHPPTYCRQAGAPCASVVPACEGLQATTVQFSVLREGDDIRTLPVLACEDHEVYGSSFEVESGLITVLVEVSGNADQQPFCWAAQSAQYIVKAEDRSEVFVPLDLSDFDYGTWGCENDLEHCSDGMDNDGDALQDCSDPACFTFCGESSPELCLDGLDNDADGTRDCEDFECALLDAC